MNVLKLQNPKLDRASIVLIFEPMSSDFRTFFAKQMNLLAESRPVVRMIPGSLVVVLVAILAIIIRNEVGAL
jgi:hypothetical protein